MVNPNPTGPWVVITLMNQIVGTFSNPLSTLSKQLHFPNNFNGANSCTTKRPPLMLRKIDQQTVRPTFVDETFSSPHVPAQATGSSGALQDFFFYQKT